MALHDLEEEEERGESPKKGHRVTRVRAQINDSSCMRKKQIDCTKGGEGNDFPLSNKTGNNLEQVAANNLATNATKTRFKAAQMEMKERRR